MSDSKRALDALPPSTVEQLIDALISIRWKADENEEVKVPLATFHLRSGRDVTGWVLKRNEDSMRGRALLIHVPGMDRFPNWDVTYLDPGSIEAVTLHDAPSSAYLLSGGKVPPREDPNAPEPPTRLGLKRRCEELSQSLAADLGSAPAIEVAWEGAPTEGAPLRSLAKALEDLVSAAKEIAADEMGKQALSQVQRFRIAQAESPSVSREGTTVQLQVNLLAGPVGRFDRARLREAMEKAL